MKFRYRKMARALHNWFSQIRLFWLILLCCGTIALYTQISLPVTSVAQSKPVSVLQNPIAIAAPSDKGLKVKCSEVPYGELTNLEQQITPLKDLPLNEVLIELDQPHFIPPPSPKGPTQVGVDLFVEEISSLSASDNSYDIEGTLDLIWCDPRSSFNPQDVRRPTKTFLEKAAEKELERIWWPDIRLMNEINPRKTFNEELIMEPDGSTMYRERFSATIASNFEMHRFPFDTQTILLQLESFSWPSSDLEFQVPNKPSYFSSEFSIPEWQILKVQEHLGTNQKRDNRLFSQAVTEITIKRDPGYYVIKIIIPMITIVGISWSVFWMIGDGLAERLGVSFTGVLTIVAYQFIISEILPRHIYNTFLDGLNLLSFGMLVLTIIENIVVNVLYLREKSDLANSIDHACRWLFPISYLGLLAILALIYFIF